MDDTYTDFFGKNRSAREFLAALGIIDAAIMKRAGQLSAELSVGPGASIPNWALNAWGTVVIGSQLMRGAQQYMSDTNEDREYALCKAMFNASLGIGSAAIISEGVTGLMALAAGAEVALPAAVGVGAAIAANLLMGRTTADLYDDLHNLPEAWEGYRQWSVDVTLHAVTQAIVAENAFEKAIVSSLESLANAFSEASQSATDLYNEAMQIAQSIGDHVDQVFGPQQWDTQNALLQTIRDLFGPFLGFPVLPDAAQFLTLLERAGDLTRSLVGDLGQWREILHFIVNGTRLGESYGDALPLTAPETQAPTVRSDPLVLDLDGDGIQTTPEGRSWAQGRAFFDFNADGFAERTGWVSGNDGLLVMDRNGDGIINNGRELFGDETIMSNGKRTHDSFRALADLDSNHDGRIDANDTAFSQLQIWKDEDEDGFSFPSELHSLAELAIQSINLTAAPGSGKDAQGNTQNRVGSFTWTDGSTGQIAEYTFQTNTAYSIATEWVDVPDDIAALPDLPGYGVVPRLQQAMARDTSGTIKSHVQSFIGATTRAARESAMQDILYAWTGSSDILASSGHDGLSGPRVGVLSAFFGQSVSVREALGSRLVCSRVVFLTNGTRKGLTLEGTQLG